MLEVEKQYQSIKTASEYVLKKIGISNNGLVSIEITEDDFNTANILIIDDKLIVKPDNDHMHAVNKETGEMIWRNNETASMPDLLTVHQDTIWFGSGGVLAIDANTGKTLIDQYEASNGSWIFPIAHHPTNGHIYTSDGDYLYCLNPKYMR